MTTRTQLFVVTNTTYIPVTDEEHAKAVMHMTVGPDHDSYTILVHIHTHVHPHRWDYVPYLDWAPEGYIEKTNSRHWITLDESARLLMLEALEQVG